jgi:hypothetical protein
MFHLLVGGDHYADLAEALGILRHEDYGKVRVLSAIRQVQEIHQDLYSYLSRESNLTLTSSKHKIHMIVLPSIVSCISK